MIPRRKLLDRTVQERDARLYFLFVEGAKTEPAYFYALEECNLVPRHRVKLHVYPPDKNANAPRYLIGKAEEVAKLTIMGADDEMWLVFDVDCRSGSTRVTQVIQSSEDATRRGWNVAVSNPCFELWLLLHFSDDLTTVTESGDSVEAAIRSILGGYDKCRTPVRCLSAEALKQAVARARTGDVEPSSPIPILPGTRVYRLIESVWRAQLHTWAD
ncbi:RloB family protein [Sorangium sp. So ce204]|uniref:RloB family protein n=1 Tax=Sorangium sp. So ce204 TaxID=3133288 RepID=UPI003F5F69C6